MAGELCPPNGWYRVTFLLESILVGDTEVKVQIEIDSKID